MSRVEHDSFRDGECLCGRGQITRHVSSTDYPFSDAQVGYELECAHCAAAWRFENGCFVDRSTDLAERAAFSAWMHAADILAQVGAEIIDAHLGRIKPSTRKAELVELVRLGLSPGSYRQYLDERRRGRSPGTIACRSPELARMLTIAGLAATKLTRPADDAKAAKARWELAASRVIRRPRP